MKNLPELILWKNLEPHEVEQFERWSRENFDPATMDINETWHPVTKAICWEMQANFFSNAAPHANNLGTKKLYEDLLHIISDFQSESPNEDTTIWMYLKAIIARQESQLINNR